MELVIWKFSLCGVRTVSALRAIRNCRALVHPIQQSQDAPDVELPLLPLHEHCAICFGETCKQVYMDNTSLDIPLQYPGIALKPSTTAKIGELLIEVGCPKLPWKKSVAEDVLHKCHSMFTADNTCSVDFLVGAAGAYSRVHIDVPLMQDTMLCVLEGEKYVCVFHESIKFPGVNEEAMDVQKVRAYEGLYPRKCKVVLLEAGDGVIIPAMHYHCAVNVSAAISLNATVASIQEVVDVVECTILNAEARSLNSIVPCHGFKLGPGFSEMANLYTSHLHLKYRDLLVLHGVQGLMIVMPSWEVSKMALELIQEIVFWQAVLNHVPSNLAPHWPNVKSNVNKIMKKDKKAGQ